MQFRTTTHTPFNGNRERFNRDRLPHPRDYYKSQGLKLIGRAEWVSARCPFPPHEDRSPSFRINMRSGAFKCHGCGQSGGDVLDFHRHKYGMRFVDAAKDLGAWEEPAPVAPKCVPVKTEAESPQAGARRIATPQLEAGMVPEGLHAYRDSNGHVLFYRVRVKHLVSGAKWIRPMWLKGSQYVLGEPVFPQGKPLYGVELIASRPKEIVVVCEGEKCADKLRQFGLLAITSGGATSATSADWSPVAGRKVLIWPDHDEAGQAYACAVEEETRLAGCQVRIIDPKALDLKEGEDAVDWLKAMAADIRSRLHLLEALISVSS